MSDIRKTLSAIALLALTVPAFAQESGTASDAPATEAPAAEAPASDAPATDAPEQVPQVEELSMGQAETASGEPQVGQTYFAEDHGDWRIRCVKTGEAKDPCQLYQLLTDQDGNAVAEISLFPLPEGREAAAGATIITPLETLLTRNITMTVDGANTRRYPFTFCAQAGCFARIGFTGAEVQQFKRGAQAQVVIYPAAAPDQEIALDISLSGFTAGYDAVEAKNAE